MTQKIIEVVFNCSERDDYTHLHLCCNECDKRRVIILTDNQREALQSTIDLISELNYVYSKLNKKEILA